MSYIVDIAGSSDELRMIDDVYRRGLIRDQSKTQPAGYLNRAARREGLKARGLLGRTPIAQPHIFSGFDDPNWL